MESILSYFSKLLEEPFNELIEEAADGGKIPIGYTCSYIPQVLLSIDNLIPVRVRAPGASNTELADIYLSRVICSYSRSLLEFAMDDQFDFLRGWVFAASCDHLRRLYDNLAYLKEPGFIHILDLPHRLGDASLEWYTMELENLTMAMSARFNVEYTETSIAGAIKEHNKFLHLLSEIGNLRKEDNPLISGTEFHTLLMASQVVPREIITPRVVELKEYLRSRGKIPDYRARLLLVGGQLDDPAFIDIIESTGGLVVADRICTGSIPGLSLIETHGSPMKDLAAHYLGQVSCPRMMEEFDSRVRKILQTVEEYKADGVVIEFIKFCDTWGIESSLLASEIRKAGIPVLCLEREYSLTGEGQLRTRIQAFIESMGR